MVRETIDLFLILALDVASFNGKNARPVYSLLHLQPGAATVFWRGREAFTGQSFVGRNNVFDMMPQ